MTIVRFVIREKVSDSFVTIYNHPATLKKDVKNAVEKIGFPLNVGIHHGDIGKLIPKGRIG